MPPAGHLLAFALISFALIVVPGPNVLFVISRSLMLGRVTVRLRYGASGRPEHGYRWAPDGRL